MSLELHNFRSLGTGAGGIDREIAIQRNAQGDEKAVHGESRLAGRLQKWTTEKTGGTIDRQALIDARVPVKTAFLNALAKAEGGDAAMRALRAAGLSDDWLTNDRPLTSRIINKVLDHAQQFRTAAVKHNEGALQAYLPSANDPTRRDERAAIISAVRAHPQFAQQNMSDQTLQGIVQQARTQVRDNEKAACESRFPGLSELATARNTPDRMHALTLVDHVEDHMLQSVPRDSVIRGGLDALQETTPLLGKSAWDQASMRQLDAELTAHHRTLGDLHADVISDLGTLQQKRDEVANGLESASVMLRARADAGMSRQLVDEARTAVGSYETQLKDLDNQLGLLNALAKDLPRQQELVASKQAYLQEVRTNDPLSERAVAHNNLIWAQAGQHIVDKVTQGVQDGSIRLANGAPGTVALQQAWTSVIGQKQQDYVATEHNNNSIDAPAKKSKLSFADPNANHPVKQGQKAVIDALKTELRNAGVSEADIKKLTGNGSMREAQRQALSESTLWQPVSRTMLVMRDGAVNEYTSRITPAQHWNPDFTDRYTNASGRLQGVTAGETDNLEHARNLKVSELLDGDGKSLATVVGHGVLDMWAIEDKDARQRVNEAGAKEVLELAASSNPRIEARLNAGQPMRMTHVSVNLISPDTLRSTSLANAIKPEFAEKDFTEAQFQAFQANSGDNVSMRMYDANSGQVRNVNANVDTITFSFGINSISTSPRTTALLGGVWHNVHAHNTGNMIKLVGDLGSGRDGSVGTRPGGFIGQVYDEMEKGLRSERAKAQPDQAVIRELEGQLHKLQVQTDLVKTMFTTEAFATGKGDTAKMGREILALQTLAEQSLSTLDSHGLGGGDMAATMSKGCKSDKDRGGVTDVELKSKLIMQDMGGDMDPDATLVGDDQQLYYTVSAGSGQIENQRWNTGLGGSKEAGHLKDRYTDERVRQNMSGLGAFAKA